MYFQYDYGLFLESVTHLARLWLNYVHKCICEVDFDQKSSYLWVLGLTTWTFAKYCFWSFRELYKLLLFDIVSFHFCIFVFVWSEKRPKNIVWSVLVTKKSTFAQVWSDSQKVIQDVKLSFESPVEWLELLKLGSKLHYYMKTENDLGVFNL